VENLKEDSYVAQRCIVDHIRGVGGIHNVCIDRPLLIEVRDTSRRTETEEWMSKKTGGKN
jgi:hypothetical protein